MYEKRIGKILITSGLRKPSKNKIYPTCKICGVKIKEDDLTVTIHKVGEYPTELHKNCAGRLIDVLKGAVIGASP
jgi:L-asparaginase II